MHSLSTSIVSLHSYVEPHDNKKKTTDTKPSIIYFLALFYVFLSMGFGTGLIGPTLLKFGEQTKSPLDQLVYLLFARSFGFLFGTLIGGVLIDRFAAFGRILLTFAVFVMCITTLSMPFIYHLIPMIIIHLLWGFTAGIVDNLTQILTIRHYENSNVNPYLQALHGAFGIGAFISPLIIAPFLGKSKPIDEWHYAYWLIGCLHIPNIIWIFVYAIRRDECCSKKIQEINLENKEFVSETKQIDDIIPSDEKKTKSSDNSSSKSLLILILITIFILLYVGTESAIGSYLHTYASLHLHFEKDIAAYLSSVFWFSFTIGRLCGIPFSIKFSPLQMILADLIGCISSLTLLFVFNKSSLILWIGSILYGFSVGSIYASAISYTDKHMPITGKRMSCLAVGGSAGEAIIPLLVGYSMNSKLLGSISLIFITLVVVVLSSLFFVAIVLYVKHQSKKDKGNNLAVST